MKVATALLGVCSLVLGAVSAVAADDRPDDPAAAAQAFRAGVAAAEASRWEEALLAFELSYRLRPHPNTLLNLAGAEAQTGKLVRALRDYERYLETVPATPSTEMARQTVADYAERLRARVAHLSLAVAGGSPGDEVRIDGQSVEWGADARAHDLDPGEHALTVVRGARELHREAVTLAEGERRTHLLRVPTALSPVAGEGTGGRTEDDDGSVLGTWWFWTAAGVVVVGGVVAAVLLASAGDDPTRGDTLGEVRVP